MTRKSGTKWKKEKIKIFGYLWCSFSYNLASELKDAGFEYESHPMEDPVNRDFIAYKLGLEGIVLDDIKTPIVAFKNNHLVMRPSFQDVWSMVKKLNK